MRSIPVRFLVVVLAVVVVGATVSFLQTSAGDGILHALGLRTHPATYTELWFEDGTTEGSVPASGEVRVEFSVRNHGESTRQPWRIVLGPTGTVVASQGVAEIADGEVATTSTTVRATCDTADATGRISVSVELPDTDVLIMRWLTCNNEPAGGAAP